MRSLFCIVRAFLKMKHGVFSWWSMALATVAIRSAIAVCNNYEDKPRPATIGQRMVLTCTIDKPCHSLRYEWYRIDGTVETRLPEEGGSDSELVVSENVTSAAEVGGQIYECYCFNTTSCRSFKIGVNPKVQLSTSTSNNVAKSGSSVNVICTAESYPPADSVSNYLMKHPKNTFIEKDLLPGMDGVVHKIVAATKEQDAGEYECSVNVILDVYPGKPLDSNVAIVNLSVYDAPSIVQVRNFTVYLDIDVEQSAILECAVSNTEDNLEVWVNWTTMDGKEIKEEHVTFRKGDVFYLLLYNATAADYMCQLFSTYSPNDVEDKKVVAVVFSESPTTSTEGLTPTTEKCNGILISILISVLVAVLLVAAISAVIFYFYRRMKKTKVPISAPETSRDSRRRTNTYVDFDASAGIVRTDGGDSSKETVVVNEDTLKRESEGCDFHNDDNNSITITPEIPETAESSPNTNPGMLSSASPSNLSGISDSFSAMATEEDKSAVPIQKTEVVGSRRVSFFIENPNDGEISEKESDSEREDEASSTMETATHRPLVHSKSFPFANSDTLTDSLQLSPKYKKSGPRRRSSSTTSDSKEEAKMLLPDARVGTRRGSASRSPRKSSTISTDSTSKVEKGTPQHKSAVFRRTVSMVDDDRKY